MIKTVRIAAILSMITAVTACGSTATRPVALDTPPPEATDLPAVALSPDLLYSLLLGEIAGQRGQLDVALASLKRAALASRDPRLAERATLVGLYSRHASESMETARLWVELRPGSIDAREALAVVLLETGDVTGARQEFGKILDLAAGANLSQTYLRVAATLGRQQNRAAALDILQSLVAVHPDQPEAYFALGHLAVRVGDLAKADAAIDRALQLRPDWEDAALFKTRVLVSRKDVQKVLDYNEKYLKSYPRANGVRMNYARYLVDLKQWDKAREQFRRVLAQNPGDADALFAVGLLSLQSNMLEDAEKYLRMNLEVQPDNDQARMYLGQVAEQRKLYPEAAQWYREVSSGGFYFEAQVRLALMMARQGDMDGARKYLHDMQPETESQQAQLALAEEQMLREAKRYDEAFKVLTAALRKLPDNSELLYARSLVAEKLDRLDTHEADLRRLLRKDPKNAHALNALGYTLADRTTRHREALELLEKALALKPDDAFIMDSMGWVQYRLGRHDEAVKYLKAALALRPDAEIAAHLGEVLWVMGDRAGAESVWSRALKDTPDSEVLLGIIKKFKQ